MCDAREWSLILEVRMTTESWTKDPDAALAEAKTSRKGVMLDFSAAPA